MLSVVYYSVGNDKSKQGIEEPADDSKTKLKKKQFPGLCIPDDQQRAQILLYDKEDEKVAAEALTEASGCVVLILMDGSVDMSCTVLTNTGP